MRAISIDPKIIHTLDTAHFNCLGWPLGPEEFGEDKCHQLFWVASLARLRAWHLVVKRNPEVAGTTSRAVRPGSESSWQFPNRFVFGKLNISWDTRIRSHQKPSASAGITLSPETGNLPKWQRLCNFQPHWPWGKKKTPWRSLVPWNARQRTGLQGFGSWLLEFGDVPWLTSPPAIGAPLFFFWDAYLLLGESTAQRDGTKADGCQPLTVSH